MRLSLVLFSIALILSCNSSKNTMTPNQLSRSEKNEGWQLLFDGSSSAGWHRYGGGRIDSAWKTTDGMLWLDIAAKKGLGVKGDWDIVTDEEYENFELEMEWRISPKGNSGIVFLIHEDKAKYNWPWETGPEMQVLDNDGHPDAKINKHRAGDLYDLIACNKEMVKPVGEWNKARIHLLHGKLDLYLNGQNVVTTMLWDDNWKKLVAGSKWKNYPDFTKYRKGRIGLQDHGDVVYYRNIKIKRL